MTFAPVEHGFAALGLADQFNSGGAVTARKWDGETQCAVELRDGGAFLAWSSRGPDSVVCGGVKLNAEYDRSTGRLSVNIPEGGPRTVVLRWPSSPQAR